MILGSVGRNFAAGMSGGIAFVYDPQQVLHDFLNRGLVQLEKVEEKEDVAILQSFIDQVRGGGGVLMRVGMTRETDVGCVVHVLICFPSPSSL